MKVKDVRKLCYLNNKEEILKTYTSRSAASASAASASAASASAASASAIAINDVCRRVHRPSWNEKQT